MLLPCLFWTDDDVLVVIISQCTRRTYQMFTTRRRTEQTKGATMNSTWRAWHIRSSRNAHVETTKRRHMFLTIVDTTKQKIMIITPHQRCGITTIHITLQLLRCDGADGVVLAFFLANRCFSCSFGSGCGLSCLLCLLCCLLLCLLLFLLSLFNHLNECKILVQCVCT